MSMRINHSRPGCCVNISMIEFLIDGNVHRVVRGVKLLLRYSLIRLGGVDGEEAHRILLGK